jgi:uncharacterized membrane protein YcaP (DUF421 family)
MSSGIWFWLIAALVVWAVWSMIGASSRARRNREGDRVTLVDHGKINEDGLAKANMTPDALKASLRRKGFQSVADVEFAVLDPDGQVVVETDTARPPTKGNGTDPETTNNMGNMASTTQTTTTATGSTVLPNGRRTPSFSEGISSVEDSQFGSSLTDPSGGVYTKKTVTGQASYTGSTAKQPKTVISNGKVNVDNLSSLGKDQGWLLESLKGYGVVTVSEVSQATADTTGLVTVEKKDSNGLNNAATSPDSEVATQMNNLNNPSSDVTGGGQSNDRIPPR